MTTLGLIIAHLGAARKNVQGWERREQVYVLVALVFS